MRYCIKCGEKIDNDELSFCPFCRAPLTKEKRSFAARTVLGPGGFKADEIPEYLTRKSEAITMMVIGVVVGIGSGIAGLFLFSYENPATSFALIFFGLITGSVLAAYGQHQWSKITHIMWTRQALREYGSPTIIEEKRSGKKISQPLKVEILPEDNLVDKKQRIKELLEKLDERLVNGEIKEETYQELKSKYQTKLDTIDSKIRGEASKK
jgi:hypothetical protein